MEPKPNVALRVAIAASGETQRAIAARARVPETRFSAIARGRIVPSVAEQKRIARTLASTVDRLFSDGAELANDVVASDEQLPLALGEG